MGAQVRNDITEENKKRMDTGSRDVLKKGQKIGEGSVMRRPTPVETLVDDDNNDGGGGGGGGGGDDAIHLMI